MIELTTPELILIIGTTIVVAFTVFSFVIVNSSTDDFDLIDKYIDDNIEPLTTSNELDEVYKEAYRLHMTNEFEDHEARRIYRAILAKRKAIK